MPSTLYNPDGTRTGLRINARSRRTYHMGGEPRGGLFTEPTKGEKWEMHERARARRDAAASMLSAVATATPAKPEADGMLVPGPSGSSVWKTKDQIQADAEKRASRAAARRKGVNMTPATSPKAQPGFTFPKLEGGRPRVATFAKFKI